MLNTMSIMKNGLLVDIDDLKGSLKPCNVPYTTKRFAPSLSKVGLRCMRTVGREGVITSLIKSYQDMIRRYPNI